jgi:hypothetical protein
MLDRRRPPPHRENKLLAADRSSWPAGLFLPRARPDEDLFDRSLSFGHKPHPTWKPGLARDVIIKTPADVAEDFHRESQWTKAFMDSSYKVERCNVAPEIESCFPDLTIYLMISYRQKFQVLLFVLKRLCPFFLGCYMTARVEFSQGGIVGLLLRVHN